MTEYVWASPGGTYVVPDDFRHRLVTEFPDYRIRWSLRTYQWQLEQRVGSGALPPHRLDPSDDSLIRAADGYWLIMEFRPGDRFACIGLVDKFTNQRCGMTLKAPFREGREIVCPHCRKAGRDGRAIAAYWPFDEALLEHLRFGDPLKGGTVKQRVKADNANTAMLAEAERKKVDAATSIDAVDHRWLTGIPAAGHSRRRIDSSTFR